jgi:O-antigen ligase
MGINALLLGIYAAGMRWLNWNALPWLRIGGDTEQFNVAFFHHCGASACFNTGCLILIFHLAATQSSRPVTAAKLLFGVLILALGAAVLPLWHSESAMVIAAGLLCAGFAWSLLAKIARPSSSCLRAALAMLFASLFAWQAQQIWHLHKHHSDGWKGAEATLLAATDRDAHVREMAGRRGDRLVVSAAPPRPVAWTAALRMAADHPLLGPGPGSWIKLIPLYSNEPIIQTFFQHRQFAHHDLLQIAAEWGILPALLFLILWIGGLMHATAAAGNHDNVHLSIIVGLLTLALHSLLHFPLQIPALQIWAALLLGVAWSTQNHSSAPP